MVIQISLSLQKKKKRNEYATSMKCSNTKFISALLLFLYLYIIFISLSVFDQILVSDHFLFFVKLTAIEIYCQNLLNYI